MLRDVRPDFAGIFIRDSQNDQPFLPEPPIRRFQIGHLLAAVRAPGGREIDEHHAAPQFL
jgi:hypothetical protein